MPNGIQDEAHAKLVLSAIFGGLAVWLTTGTPLPLIAFTITAIKAGDLMRP